jgi:hypothetical protein
VVCNSLTNDCVCAAAAAAVQVAAVKLKHVGLALQKGVDVLLLDLDVGFLRDPMSLFEG